jgi:hypothetical protein
MPKDHNHTGRSFSGPSSYLRKASAVPDGQPFVWQTREMLESPAMRVMSLTAHRLVQRIMIEHMAHSGRENGNLICTYNDFETYGVRRNSIAVAITEADALGWIKVVKRGHFAVSEFREPSLYRIEWLPDKDARPASNRWKNLKSLDDAREVVRRSRPSRRPLKQRPILRVAA